MATAYCEEEDVQEAILESDAKFGTAPLDTGNVKAAIHGASQWFKHRSNAHFYDSGTPTLIDSTTASATTTQDIPVAAHRQSGQLWQVSERGIEAKYPVQHAGPYTRITLPYRWVESIDTLKVRDAGGGFDDWVAGSQVEGEGEDYYLRTDGASQYGRSYLYIHTGGLHSLINYDDVLEIGLSYGVDYQDVPWDDVRRGIAALAGAQLLSDSEVLAGLPDQANLPGYDTIVSRLSGQAMSLAENAGGYLTPYLKQPVV